MISRPLPEWSRTSVSQLSTRTRPAVWGIQTHTAWATTATTAEALRIWPGILSFDEKVTILTRSFDNLSFLRTFKLMNLRTWSLRCVYIQFSRILFPGELPRIICLEVWLVIFFWVYKVLMRFGKVRHSRQYFWTLKIKVICFIASWWMTNMKGEVPKSHGGSFFITALQ